MMINFSLAFLHYSGIEILNINTSIVNQRLVSVVALFKDGPLKNWELKITISLNL